MTRDARHRHCRLEKRRVRRELSGRSLSSTILARSTVPPLRRLAAMEPSFPDPLPPSREIPSAFSASIRSWYVFAACLIRPALTQRQVVRQREARRHQRGTSPQVRPMSRRLNIR